MPTNTTHLLLYTLLISASFTDLKNNTISNNLTYPGIISGLALSILKISSLTILSSLSGAIIGGAMLLPAYISGKMAAGDVKLMIMCGTFLGFPLICITMILSMLFSGLLAVLYLFMHKLNNPDNPSPIHIPFAPSVACGTITTFADPSFIHPLKILIGL